MTKILIEIDPELQRVVPIEPTEEMVWVAARHYESEEYTGVRSTYKAMLAAAPQPESVDAIANFLHQFKRHVGGDGEFWLHEIEDFYAAISQGEQK